MSDLSAEEFDLDAWLVDAKRPERSVRVYKRADLMSRLDELERLIEDAQRASAEDESLGDGVSVLEEEYQQVAQEFKDSGILVTVHALNSDERLKITEDGKKAKESAAVIGRRLIAEALVSPKISFENLERFEQAIGSAQVGLIAQAINKATEQAPNPSTPFLQKFSGRDAGSE